KVKQRCCFAGCRREQVLDLSELSWDEFMVFHIWECQGRIYCTEDCHCPWHDFAEPEKHNGVFWGSLCDEHFEYFRGRPHHLEDYFTNIGKTDPELFDRTREDEFDA